MVDGGYDMGNHEHLSTTRITFAGLLRPSEMNCKIIGWLPF